MSSSSCCYICLGSDSKKPFVENRGCLCKGSVSIHGRCFKKWVTSTENPFSCSVCKADYSMKFLSQFLTTEQIMFAKGADDEDEYDDDEPFFTEQIIHGVPVLLDEDNYVWFETPEQESRFNHSKKMEEKSFRQYYQQRSKKPFRNVQHQQHSRNYSRNLFRNTRY